MFANFVHANTGIFVHVIFSPNCSKFDVECDWSRKNSQNVQNLGFFCKKKMGVFEKKLEFVIKCHVWHFFSRMRLKRYFFFKMSFHFIFEAFLAKIRKILMQKKLESMINNQSILKKKCFYPFERHLQRCCRPLNIPTVAGCLVVHNSRNTFEGRHLLRIVRKAMAWCSGVEAIQFRRCQLNVFAYHILLE